MRISRIKTHVGAARERFLFLKGNVVDGNIHINGKRDGSGKHLRHVGLIGIARSTAVVGIREKLRSTIAFASLGVVAIHISRTIFPFVSSVNRTFILVIHFARACRGLVAK